MEQTLFIVGAACIIASVVGGGVKLFGAEIPILNSIRRQLLLAFVGLLFLLPEVIPWVRQNVPQILSAGPINGQVENASIPSAPATNTDVTGPNASQPASPTAVAPVSTSQNPAQRPSSDNFCDNLRYVDAMARTGFKNFDRAYNLPNATCEYSDNELSCGFDDADPTQRAKQLYEDSLSCFPDAITTHYDTNTRFITAKLRDGVELAINWAGSSTGHIARLDVEGPGGDAQILGGSP